jgi:hypothetical protein
MLNFLCDLRLAAILISAISAIALGAQTSSTTAYVHASRVALRAQPSATAPAAGYLTTNTAVDIQERSGEWCRVRSGSPLVAGFVACRFLGDGPLTLEAVVARLREENLSPRDRLDWASRGFWIAPSIVRLESVGVQMTEVLLPDAVRYQEMLSGSPHRQPNAEFDAMKARLAAGVEPDARDYTPRSTEGPERYYEEPVQRAMKRTSLPQISRSFFRAGEPLLAVALRPFGLDEQGGVAIGLADALSAVHRVPLKMRVLEPVGFYHGGAIGVWDIRLVGVTFAKPVTLHGITARGDVTGLEISSMRAPIGNQPCTGSAMAVVARRVNSRWLAATFAWAGKPAASTPTVTTTQIAGKTQFERFTAESVDLNGDKVADFLGWTGLMAAVIQEGAIPWKAVFANVEGKWVLVAFIQGEDCT